MIYIPVQRKKPPLPRRSLLHTYSRSLHPSLYITYSAYTHSLTRSLYAFTYLPAYLFRPATLLRYLLADVREDLLLQPRHLDLRDAEAAGDFGLGLVAVVAQVDDQALALG